MVSNDDIEIQTTHSALQDLKYTDSLGTGQWIPTWTVPANKIWVLKRIVGKRDAGTNTISMSLQGGSYAMMLRNTDTSFQEYEPEQELILPAGWIISINFHPDTSTVRRGYLIIDERDAY